MSREDWDRDDEDGADATLLHPEPTKTATPKRTPPCSTCSYDFGLFYRRCPKCEGDRNRKKQDLLAGVIRELKAGGYDANRKRELEADLKRLDHPDVDGFLAWLGARDQIAASKPQKGRR